MGEFASKGVAGTGLGLGIAGTALGLLNNGGCGNGVLGGLFGGNCNRNCGGGAAEMMAALTPLVMATASGSRGSRNSGCIDDCVETRESAQLRQQVAALQAEKYADNVGIETYKAAIQLSNRNDDAIKANQKEAFQAIAALDKQAAVNHANLECITAKLGETVGRVNRLEEKECEARVRETQLGANIAALASDTRQAIALEAERRANADESIRCWVKGTYVPGTLSLSPDSMCPKPVTCCDVLRYANDGGKMPVPSPCSCGGCCNGGSTPPAEGGAVASRAAK